MPIDGVSFSNAGFNIVNPSEVNLQAEAAAVKEAEKKVKQADKSDKTEADSEENEDVNRDLQGRYTGEDKEEEEKEKKKKFMVRFNPETEMVEMIDTLAGEVVETLTPDDLLKLLSKSKAFSGVFVDRKI